MAVNKGIQLYNVVKVLVFLSKMLEVVCFFTLWRLKFKFEILFILFFSPFRFWIQYICNWIFMNSKCASRMWFELWLNMHARFLGRYILYWNTVVEVICSCIYRAMEESLRQLQSIFCNSLVHIEFSHLVDLEFKMTYLKIQFFQLLVWGSCVTMILYIVT